MLNYRADQPFYILLMHGMITQGEVQVAQELNNIFRKEDRERKGGRYRHLMNSVSLRDQYEKLTKLAESLRVANLYHSQG
jgi:hypothetical protein